MVTIELDFERPTKRTVRFFNEDFGTVYIPNAVYEQLGRPEHIKLSLEAVAPQLAVAA
jgi:hypothetical protein